MRFSTSTPCFGIARKTSPSEDFAIGVVRGFAFALGISTLIDVAVFFWFTKPAVTLMAKQ